MRSARPSDAVDRPLRTDENPWSAHHQLSTFTCTGLSTFRRMPTPVVGVARGSCTVAGRSRAGPLQAGGVGPVDGAAGIRTPDGFGRAALQHVDERCRQGGNVTDETGQRQILCRRAGPGYGWRCRRGRCRPGARGAATGSGDRSRPRAALPALCLTQITSRGIVHYAFRVLNPEITHATDWPAGPAASGRPATLLQAAVYVGVPEANGAFGLARRVRAEDRRPRTAQKSRRMTSTVRVRWGSLRSARWATASSIAAAGRTRGR